jgi:hypothetical protein
MSADVQDLAVRYGAAWAARDLDAITAMHTDAAACANSASISYRLRPRPTSIVAGR